MTKPSERGSAIFMLFLAVALFGLLAFAFTQGSRNNMGWLGSQQNDSYAVDIIGYGNDVAMATTRLLSRGCTEKTINLKDDSGHYINPSAPSDGSCDVFSIAGGGIRAKPVISQWLLDPNSPDPNPWFNAQTAVEDVGTSSPDLVMWVRNLKPDICKIINQKIMSKDPVAESVGAQTQEFTGTYSLVAGGVGDDTNSPYKGKSSGCIGGTTNAFYVVLLAR